MLPKLAAALAVLGAGATMVLAHPVAQGAMDVIASPKAVDIRARISNEEAYVETAFRRGEGEGGLPGMYRTHGQYLIRHLRVLADGRRLAGRVLETTPPSGHGPGAFIAYHLSFDLPAGSPPPREIRLTEDLLNEFTFAPGNPWEATYIVRLSQVGGAAREGLLFTRRDPMILACNWTAGAPRARGGVDRKAMAMAFIRHGIAHILSGYDHLLFVSGLVLAVVSLADLLKVVTAFTVAHTLTLTLAVLDIVRLPSSIVEPMIAASIVFVAAQNVFSPRASRGWTRLAAAFGFGLFHGLGFAGGLLGAMAGLGGSSVVLAIAAFSLGVEIGHQMVALPLFAAVRLVRAVPAGEADPNRFALWAIRLASGAIGLAGTVYLLAAVRSA